MPDTARLRSGAALVLAAVLGMLAGVVGAFAHRESVQVGRVGVPVGLVVVLALSAGVILTSGLLLASRTGAVAAAAGWCLAPALALFPRPEGDVVVPDRPISYVWIVGGLVVAATCAVLPYRALAAGLVARARARHPTAPPSPGTADGPLRPPSPEPPGSPQPPRPSEPTGSPRQPGGADGSAPHPRISP